MRRAMVESKKQKDSPEKGMFFDFAGGAVSWFSLLCSFCFSSCSFDKTGLAREERKNVSGEVGCHIGLQQQRGLTTTATTTPPKSM